MTAAKAQEIAAMTEKQAADTEKVAKSVESMAAVVEESASGSEKSFAFSPLYPLSKNSRISKTYEVRRFFSWFHPNFKHPLIHFDLFSSKIY